MVTVEESVKPVAETGLLDIVVPYTTPRLTRLALREAQELALKLPSRIRVLRMLTERSLFCDTSGFVRYSS
jgi:hypothetical protein